MSRPSAVILNVSYSRDSDNDPCVYVKLRSPSRLEKLFLDNINDTQWAGLFLILIQDYDVHSVTDEITNLDSRISTTDILDFEDNLWIKYSTGETSSLNSILEQYNCQSYYIYFVL